jgi:hypothetical protein
MVKGIFPVYKYFAYKTLIRMFTNVLHIVSDTLGCSFTFRFLQVLN